MLNTNYIRTQVTIIAPPGPLVEGAIRNIVLEAQRYGEERASKPERGVNPGPVRAELEDILAVIQKWKKPEARMK